MKLAFYFSIIIPFVLCCGTNDKCINLRKSDYLLNDASESEALCGNFARSIAMCNDIIKDNPDNYIAFLNRGTFKHNECLSKAHMSQEEKDSIYSDIKHSLTLCPEYALGYRNLIAIAHDIEDFETVINYTKLYVSKFYGGNKLPHYSHVLSRYSFALHGTGDVREAKKYAYLAVQAEPVDTFAYLVRGICYRELGQFEEAMADFDTAIKQDTSSFLAYYERGLCLRMMNRLNEAASQYLKAQAIDSNRAESYWGLGVLKVEGGDTMSGCELYNKALFLNRNGKKLISYVNEKIMQREIERICH